MVRGVLGVLGGAVVWMVAFFTLARILFLVWPAYALPAQVWRDTGAYEFGALMSVCNALFWLMAEIAAGWTAVVIAKRREAAWVLAALLMLYLSFLHLYYVWNNFPWWYDLAVALPSGAAVLLGGKLAGRRLGHSRMSA